MRALLIPLLILLTACGREEGAGGLTAAESDQLNEAAAMLDEEPQAIEDAINTLPAEADQ